MDERKEQAFPVGSWNVDAVTIRQGVDAVIVRISVLQPTDPPGGVATLRPLDPMLFASGFAREFAQKILDACDQIDGKPATRGH
jgi:hypothetical protein